MRATRDPAAPGVRALDADLLALATQASADLLPRLLAPGAAGRAARKLHVTESAREPFAVWARGLARRIAALWLLRAVIATFVAERGLGGPASPAGVEPGKGAARRLARALAALAGRDSLLRDALRPRPHEVARPGDGPAGVLLGLLRARRAELARADGQLLGDLYERLDAAGAGRRDLVQTPPPVVAWLLERTLEPALAELGVEGVRVIDPACGTGHFLVAAFERLAGAWRRAHPDLPEAEVAARALGQVAGVDLDPYACALARLRLALAAADHARSATGARGDGARRGGLRDGPAASRRGGPRARPEPVVFCADALDPPASGPLADLLAGGFAVVVGNPPFSRPADAAARARCRRRYVSAYRKFGLTAPFVERAFALAASCREAPPPARGSGRSAPPAAPSAPPGAAAPPGERPSRAEGTSGWVGLVVADDFATREWGRPLVEQVLARVDLTEVVDAGHADLFRRSVAPLLLVGRARAPRGDAVRVARGKRGGGPGEDGRAWAALAGAGPGHDDAWVAVRDVPRAELARHPWALGGDAAALKARLEAAHQDRLARHVASAGFLCITGDDDAWVRPREAWLRAGARPRWLRPFVAGRTVRDWSIRPDGFVLFPYAGGRLAPAARLGPELAALAPWRAVLLDRQVFDGRTYAEAGRAWYQHHQVALDRLEPPLGIVLAFIERTSHFVLVREPLLARQTAPVIKLAPGASEDDHLALLAVLNSSTAELWLRQACKVHPGRAPFQDVVERSATRLGRLPLPDALRERRVEYARALTDLCATPAGARVEAVVRDPGSASDLRRRLVALRRAEADRARRAVALQDELDWAVYEAYGLIAPGATVHVAAHEVAGLERGQRPFELLLARRGERGWFEALGVAPSCELPAAVPAGYRAVLEARCALIEREPALAVLERPEHKRRWALRADFDDEVREACTSLLLDRVEAWLGTGPPRARTVEEVAERLAGDAHVLAVAEVLRGPGAPSGSETRDVEALVAVLRPLVAAQAVAQHPSQRYSPRGLVKHEAWRTTWAAERVAARGEAADVPLPPDYTRADFRDATTWRLRGRLDVPRERFVAFAGVPGGTRYAWAGWTPPQRARALAALDRDLTRAGAPLVRRCGALQGLWSLVPDLDARSAGRARRAAEAACGRTACPCPVAAAWAATLRAPGSAGAPDR